MRARSTKLKSRKKATAVLSPERRSIACAEDVGQRASCHTQHRTTTGHGTEI